MAHPNWTRRFNENEDSLPFGEFRMMAIEKRFLCSLSRFSYCSDISFHAVRDWTIGIESVILAINSVPERTFIP